MTLAGKHPTASAVARTRNPSRSRTGHPACAGVSIEKGRSARRPRENCLSAREDTAMASPTGSVYIRAGPFIVPQAYARLAIPLINAFGSDVVVYQTTSDVTVDVRYTLTFKPKVAVNSANAAIHTDILNRAGIPNYDVISDFN